LLQFRFGRTGTGKTAGPKNKDPEKLSQNFSFGESYLGFRRKIGLLTVFSETIPKTNRVLRMAPGPAQFDWSNHSCLRTGNGFPNGERFNYLQKYYTFQG
jgi:hypothetical protein